MNYEQENPFKINILIDCDYLFDRFLRLIPNVDSTFSY